MQQIYSISLWFTCYHSLWSSAVFVMSVYFANDIKSLSTYSFLLRQVILPFIHSSVTFRNRSSLLNKRSVFSLANCIASVYLNICFLHENIHLLYVIFKKISSNLNLMSKNKFKFGTQSIKSCHFESEVK